jgi:hypothetical protein
LPCHATRCFTGAHVLRIGSKGVPRLVDCRLNGRPGVVGDLLNIDRRQNIADAAVTEYVGSIKRQLDCNLDFYRRYQLSDIRVDDPAGTATATVFCPVTIC